MRAAMALLALVALTGCEPTDSCQVTEGTGLFEIFKTEGCTAVDVTVDPSQGVTVDFLHSGNTVLVDGLDDVGITLVGRLYVGRRGSCFLIDNDAARPAALPGHCDYFIRDFAKKSETESYFTVELTDVYAEAYGNKGTLRAVMSVSSFDQGFGP